MADREIIPHHIIWVHECARVRDEYYIRKLLISSDRPSLDENPTFFGVPEYGTEDWKVKLLVTGVHRATKVRLVADNDVDAWKYVCNRFFLPSNFNIEVIDLSSFESVRPIRIPTRIEIRDKVDSFFWASKEDIEEVLKQDPFAKEDN